MASIWPSTISMARTSNSGVRRAVSRALSPRARGRRAGTDAKRWSTSRVRGRVWKALVAALAATAFLASYPRLLACPFCTALAPTLAQLREQAAVVALAEVERAPTGKPATLRLHRVSKGDGRLS